MTAIRFVRHDCRHALPQRLRCRTPDAGLRVRRDTRRGVSADPGGATAGRHRDRSVRPRDPLPRDGAHRAARPAVSHPARHEPHGAGHHLRTAVGQTLRQPALPRGRRAPPAAQPGVQGLHTASQRAPKAFVDTLPRHFVDPLPTLAARIKSKPALVVDHEITYAEAEPWLAGRDRATFEKRFASRLRDPAFRAAVRPSLARYPTWDRMLNPEKYAPKAEPVK